MGLTEEGVNKESHYGSTVTTVTETVSWLAATVKSRPCCNLHGESRPLKKAWSPFALPFIVLGGGGATFPGPLRAPWRLPGWGPQDSRAPALDYIKVIFLNLFFY